MQMFVVTLLLVLGCLCGGGPTRPTQSQPPAMTVIDPRMHHLRAGAEREWDSFTGNPEKELSVTFVAGVNAEEATLSLRQEDVKVKWTVTLNGRDLGRLDEDENPRVRYLPIPPALLKPTGNVLTIRCNAQAVKADMLPDDMRAGDIRLHREPLHALLGQAQVAVRVTDRITRRPIPSRITIVTLDNALQPIRVSPRPQLAVRTGCIYTATGEADFHLPEGRYKLYATRGFEYGADSATLAVKRGKPLSHAFSLAREVPTEGWVASDTHIHTLTNSGHGDATVQERMVTIAGEGIELPIFTDHNKVYNPKPLIREMGLDTVFTPVTGNEFTTKVGHFNVFPLADEAKPADHDVTDWKSVSEVLSAGKQIVVLNHGRNVFYNFQPFGPERHISAAGQDLDGWQMPANAMEVVNSSAQQKDIMQLYHDWFGLLNRGQFLTPVGSSDSHDVMRYLLGQGRTYIRSTDYRPGAIPIAEATENFLQGRVMVSFGLMAELQIDGRYGPGEMAPLTGKTIRVNVRVLGPSWVKASRISLYANGRKIREAAISGNGKDGVKWEGSWTVPVGTQDMHFAAIAEGPDPARPFWVIPKPFSRTSSVFHPQVIGSSGAVWVDADGDARRTSAFEYARRLVGTAGNHAEVLLKQLATFDEAVAIQVASILQEQVQLAAWMAAPAFQKAPAHVQSGFRIYADAWRLSKSR